MKDKYSEIYEKIERKDFGFGADYSIAFYIPSNSGSYEIYSATPDDANYEEAQDFIKLNKNKLIQTKYGVWIKKENQSKLKNKEVQIHPGKEQSLSKISTNKLFSVLKTAL